MRLGGLEKLAMHYQTFPGTKAYGLSVLTPLGLSVEVLILSVVVLPRLEVGFWKNR